MSEDFKFIKITDVDTDYWIPPVPFFVSESFEAYQEILRLRTTENAAAHALDCLRQDLGLELVQGEHPSNTAKRIRCMCDIFTEE